MKLVKSAAERDARARAARIRRGITDYLETLAVVAQAYEARDWATLGYGSWEAYVDEEFGADRLRLSPEHRQKAVQELRLAGLSNRAIGSTLGVDEKTVRNDARGAENSAPAEVIGADGKRYASTKPAPAPAPDTPADRDASPVSTRDGQPGPDACPAGVDVTDGAGETSAAPTADTGEAATSPGPGPVMSPAGPGSKPHRRPLPDAFQDAAYDVAKAADRVGRLVLDDRFSRNAEQVARLCRHDLLRAADLLITVLGRLPDPNKESTDDDPEH